MGLEVEARHITVNELETVSEAAACGTSAVASPVGEIDDLDTGKKYIIATKRPRFLQLNFGMPRGGD